MTLSTGMSIDVNGALQRLVGEGHVRAATEMIDGHLPRWLAEPESAAELARVLAFADGNALRVVACGGGSKLDWGNPPAEGPDILLSTRRLNRVLEHAASDMTATVQTGCTVAEFGKTLAQRGQRLALDPLWPARATIGGILAMNDSGALVASFGTIRDHLIGVTIALADGTLAKSGGKVVKNVAGYDLPKLIIGSWGTLGIITEATFRLYPLAHASETLRFSVPTHEMLGGTLRAMADCSAVTTAVQIEAEDAWPATVLVLVEGLADALHAKVQRVMQAAQRCGAVRLEPSPDAWSERERLFENEDACVCKVSMLPTRWPEFLKHVRDIAERSGVRWKLSSQLCGIGLLRLHGAPQPRTAEALTALRDLLQERGGLLTVLRCPPALKKQFAVWPDARDALPLMRRVKEQFDPHGILSPGRFVGGI